MIFKWNDYSYHGGFLMKKQMFSVLLLLSLGVTSTTKSNVYSTGVQTIFSRVLGKSSGALHQLLGIADGNGVTGNGIAITQNPLTGFDSSYPRQIVVNLVGQATPPTEQVVQTPLGQAVGTMADSVARFVGSGFDALKHSGYAVRDFNYGQAFEAAVEKVELVAQTLQEKVADGAQYVFDVSQDAQNAVRNFDYAGSAQTIGKTLQNNAQTVANILTERAQSVAQTAQNEIADLKEGVGVAGQQVQHAAEFTQGYVADAVLNVPQAAQIGVGRLQDGFHAVTALTINGVKQAAQTVIANPTETACAAINAVKDAVIANPGRTAFGLVGGYAANKLAKGRGVVTRTLATAGGALAANFVSEEMARVALATGIAAKFVVANVKAIRAKIKQNSEISIKDQNEAINKFVNERILNPTGNKVAKGLNIITFINPSYPSTMVVIRNGNTSFSRSYQFFTGADYKAMDNANDEEKTGYINQATQDVEMLQSLPDALKASVIDYLTALESYFKQNKTSAAKARFNQSRKALKQALEIYNSASSITLSA